MRYEFIGLETKSKQKFISRATKYIKKMTTTEKIVSCLTLDMCCVKGGVSSISFNACGIYKQKHLSHCISVVNLFFREPQSIKNLSRRDISRGTKYDKKKVILNLLFLLAVPAREMIKKISL